MKIIDFNSLFDDEDDDDDDDGEFTTMSRPQNLNHLDSLVRTERSTWKILKFLFLEKCNGIFLT